jgi:hypothetical protein
MKSSLMSFRAASAVVLVLVSLCPLDASAQTSIGFADKDDLDALLAYRLPTWSYRTWFVDGGLDGGGADSARADETSMSNAFHFDLGSSFLWSRQSDRRDIVLEAAVDGDYDRRSDGRDELGSRRTQVSGRYELAGYYRHVWADDRPWVAVKGRVYRSYAESDRQQWGDGYDEEESNLQRRATNEGGAELGIGRIRDVTPLVRAQRVSERLAALGRPRLTSGQVRRVAEALATQYGYDAVYERPDRRFWRDALAPALEGQEPLTPFEMHYLMEVLRENVGARRQGWELAVTADYVETVSRVEHEESRWDTRSLGVRAAWARNLTLNHQLELGVTTDYGWRGAATYEDGVGRASLFARHLWAVADRCHLLTYLGVSGSYAEREPDLIARTVRTELRPTLNVYLEDQLRLYVGGLLYNTQNSAEPSGDRGRVWGWSYNVGLSYDLQRIWG